MPLDYSRFDRLIEEDEQEERRLAEGLRQAEEARVAALQEARLTKQNEALRRAEAEWREASSGGTPAGQTSDGIHQAGDKPKAPDPRVANQEEEDEEEGTAACPSEAGVHASEPRCKAAGVDFDAIPEKELEKIDIDDFFRPMSEQEKEEGRRKKEEADKRLRQREEAAGRRPLWETGLSPEQLRTRIEHLESDRREMAALMDRCDRPPVKARLGEFLLDMDNELARLREDPLQLDDEDRKELRLFQLRRWQLPGVARAQQEFADQVASEPRPLGTAEPIAKSHEEPWEAITVFSLDLGDEEAPFVTVDVRLEAVERLPENAVTCDFAVDSFDLRVVHGLQARRVRLRKMCLQRDIDPKRSSVQVKRNHVLVKLAKVPEPLNEDADRGTRSEVAHPASFAPWTDLCAPDRRRRNLRPRPTGPPPWAAPAAQADWGQGNDA